MLDAKSSLNPYRAPLRLSPLYSNASIVNTFVITGSLFRSSTVAEETSIVNL